MYGIINYLTDLRQYAAIFSKLVFAMWTKGLQFIGGNLRVGSLFDKQQHPYPLTNEQHSARKEKFIYDLIPAAICRLASRYNDGRKCRIFRTGSGSFNACFFVEFPEDGTRWVVRIPIEPAIYDCWAKVKTEVATMRYICNKTTIPLPRVHGFGQEEGLCSDRFKSLAYLIIDYIPGQSLNIKSLAKDTRERRDHFYIQLIDILAQMRQLEFPSAGSLTLDRDGDFVVGPLSDIPSNTVQIDSFGTAPPSKVFTSATEFIRYQFEVLRNAYELPVSEQTLQEIQLELFALGEMERELHNFVDTHAKWERGPFILCHMDLRWPNIIVDDDLNILAVIDWEWSASIPRFLFVPPSWIAGREPQYVTGQEYHAEFTHFHRILLARREISNGHRQLAQEWDIELLSRAELPIALLLRYHSQLTDIFYQTIYPRLFKNPRRMVMKLFDSSTGLASEAQKRYESSQRYTQHLKDDGLFVPDERAKALHELQKIMQQLREKRALKDGLSLQRQTK